MLTAPYQTGRNNYGSENMKLTNSIESLTDNAIAIFMIAVTAYCMVRNITISEAWYGFVGMAIAFYFQKKV